LTELLIFYPEGVKGMPDQANGSEKPATRCLDSALAAPKMRFFGVPFLRGTAREINAIHLCPSRIHLASIRDGSELQVSNRLTFKSLPLGEWSDARLVAFRPGLDLGSGELAIAGPLDRPGILRFDIRGEKPLEVLACAGVSALHYSSDGRFLAAGTREGGLRVWHLGPDGAAQVGRADFDAQVESLVFHPEHPTVYATLASGALVRLELAPGLAAPVEEALNERAPGARFQRVAAGPAGYPIYLAGRDHRVYVVDTATGETGAFDPEVGPILGLEVLHSHLCVWGPNTVYLTHAVGPATTEHLALVCGFDAPIYGVSELPPDCLLVFHAAEGAFRAAS
jgi:hypothetical protein